MSIIWPSRSSTQSDLESALRKLATKRHLPGIADPRALQTLVLQILASLRREDYTSTLMKRTISANRADPSSSTFDADRAVVYNLQNRDIDEAAWLIFLITHFGKPADSGWRRLVDVYGRLGTGRWSWTAVSQSPKSFDAWLVANWQSIAGKFGNHRKYETLDPSSANSTRYVIQSYLNWVGPSLSHVTLFANAVRAAGNDPHRIFDALYRGMTVRRFGRLAKFDYLSLIGRYGIAPIAPGSAYLNEATGPADGARLLFGINTPGRAGYAALQAGFDDLSAHLGVGMQVLEDAVCNWQKSPTVFKHFKG